MSTWQVTLSKLRNSFVILSQNKFFFKIGNRNLIRNTVSLFSGTLFSQILVMVLSPVLTRLYPVKAFGDFAIFSAITAFVATLSTGKYELALSLTSSDNDSYKILKIIHRISLVISIIFFVSIIVFKFFFIHNVMGFFTLPEIFIAPVYVYLVGIQTGLNYWFQKYKRFNILSIGIVIQAVIMSGVSIILGYYFNMKNGMIIALPLSILSVVVFFLLKEINLVKNVFSQKKIIPLIRTYSIFPKYSILSDFLIVISYQFTPIILSILYNSNIVGFYVLANRITRIPNIFTSSALASLFRPEFTEKINNNGRCDHFFSFVLKRLFLSSFLFLLVFLLFSPIIFVKLFGEQWIEAAYISQILSFSLCFEFVASPLNVIFQVRKENRVLMNLQLLQTFFSILGLYLGYSFYSSHYHSLFFYSIASIIFNAISIFLAYRLSQRTF